MAGRAVPILVALAAALSGGCAGLWPRPKPADPAPTLPAEQPAPQASRQPQFQPASNLADKSVPPLFDNTASGPPAANGPPVYAPQPAGQPDPNGWVVPAGYRPEYGQMTAQPMPPPRTPAVAPPNQGPQPGGDPWAVGGDPHWRAAPTATGQYLNLGPGETPIDRAADLVRRIDAVTAENKALTFRVRTLETAAAEREQAIAESLREVEASTADVARARTEVQGMKAEIAKLKDRVKKVEQDEIETLNFLIEELKKVIRPEPAGKK